MPYNVKYMLICRCYLYYNMIYKFMKLQGVYLFYFLRRTMPVFLQCCFVLTNLTIIEIKYFLLLDAH